MSDIKPVQISGQVPKATSNSEQVQPIQVAGPTGLINPEADARFLLKKMQDESIITGVSMSNQIAIASGIKMLNHLGFDDVNQSNYLSTVEKLMGGVDGHYKLDYKTATGKLDNLFSQSLEANSVAFRVADAYKAGKIPDQADIDLMNKHQKNYEGLANMGWGDLLLNGLALLSSPFVATSVYQYDGSKEDKESLNNRAKAFIDKISYEVQNQLAQQFSGAVRGDVGRGFVVGAGVGMANAAMVSSGLASTGAGLPAAGALEASAGLIGGAIGASSAMIAGSGDLAGAYARVQLEEDPELRKLSKAQKDIYAGAISAIEILGEVVGEVATPYAKDAVTGVSKAFMTKAAKDAFRLSASKAIVNGSLKSWVTSASQTTAGKMLTSATNESVSEVLTQIAQNTIPDGLAMLYNKITGQGTDFSPDFSKWADGVEQAAVSAFVSSMGIGGAWHGLTASQRALRNSLSSAVSSIQSVSASRKLASQEPVLPEAVVAADIPELSGKSLYASVSESGVGDVSVSTDQQVAHLGSQKESFMTQESFVGQITAKYGDSPVVQAIVDVLDGKEVPESNFGTNVDYQSIKHDIAPFLGKQDPPQVFADALRDIGINATQPAKSKKIVFQQGAKVKTLDIATSSGISQAKSEGYDAVIWKTGDTVSGKVFNPESVVPVQGVQDVMPEPAVTTDATTETVIETPTPNADTLKSVKIDKRKIGYAKHKKAISQNIQSVGISEDQADSIAEALAHLSVVNDVTGQDLSRLAGTSIKTDKKLGKVVRGYVKKGKFIIDPETAIVSLFVMENPPAITVMHEYLHAYFFNAPEVIAQEIKTIYGFHPVEDMGTKEWDSGMEVLVDDLFKYVHTNEAKTSTLKKIFESIKVWLANVIDAYLKARPQYQKGNRDVKEFFDKLFSGQFSSVAEAMRSGPVDSTGKTELYSKEKIEKGMDDFKKEAMFDVEFTEKDVLDAFANGLHSDIPTYRLRELAETNDEIKKQYLVRLVNDEAFMAMFEKSDLELEKDYGFSQEDFDLRNFITQQIGLKTSEWNAKFMEFIARDGNLAKFVEAMKSLYPGESLKAVIPDWYFENLGSKENDAMLTRHIKRNVDQFRGDFWSAMAKEEKNDIEHRAYKYIAYKNADFERSKLEYQEEAKEYDPNDYSLQSVIPTQNFADVAKMSNDKVREELEMSQIEIDRLESRMSELGESKKEVQKQLNILLGRQKAKKTRALNSRKVINKAIKNLSGEAGTRIHATFADVIDFLANHSNKYMTAWERARYPEMIAQLDKLVQDFKLGSNEKSTYSEFIHFDENGDISSLGVDMKYIAEILMKDIDAMTLEDINYLIETKKELARAGHELFEQMKQERHTDPGLRYQSLILQEQSDNGKLPLSYEDIDEYFRSEEVQALVRKGYHPDLIKELNVDDLTEIPKIVSKHNREVMQKAKDVIRQEFAAESKEEKSKRKKSFIQAFIAKSGVNKDSNLYQSVKNKAELAYRESEKERFSEAVKKLYEVEAIKLMTEDQINEALKQINDGNGSKITRFQLVPKSSKEAYKNAYDKGRFWTKKIYARGFRSGDRFLENIEGFNADGPIKKMYWGLANGYENHEGWQAKKIRETIKLHKELKEVLIKNGIKMSDLSGKKTVFDKDGNIVKVKDKEIDNLNYFSFTIEGAMEIYSAHKSRQKFDAVTHGNKIPVDVQNAVIANMTEQQKNVAEWIMSKYEARYLEWRIAHELYYGVKIGRVQERYSPISRMGSDYDSAIQEVSGSSNADSIGNIRVGLKKSRALSREEQIDADHQIPIALDFVSGFLRTMDSSLNTIYGSDQAAIIKIAMAFGNESSMTTKQKSVRHALMTSLGRRNYEWLKDLWEDLITQDPEHRVKDSKARSVTAWITRVLGFSNIAMLAGNIISIASQVLLLFQMLPEYRSGMMGLLRSVAYLPATIMDQIVPAKLVDVFTKGKVAFGGKRMASMMHQLSPQTYLTAFEPLETEIASYEKNLYLRATKGVSNFVMIFQTMLDQAAKSAVHKALINDEMAYQKKQFGKDNLTTGNLEHIRNIAINKATSSILRTQPGPDVIAQSLAFKRFPMLAKALFPFSQSIMKIWDQATHDSVVQGRILLSTKFLSYQSRIAILKIFWTSVMLGASAIAMFVLRYGDLPDWEDDEDKKRLSNDIVSQMGPVGRVATPVAFSIFFNAPYFQNPMTPTPFSIFDKSVKKLTAGYENQDIGSAISGAVTAASFVAPIPVLLLDRADKAYPYLEGNDYAKALSVLGGQR